MVKKKHVNDPPCDKEPVSISIGDHDEDLFEEQHVHRIYEDISVHFSHTRYGPWKNVVRLINEAPTNSFILDVGCGNGKYLNSRRDCFFLGIDVCSALLQICSEKGKTDLLLSNNLRLGIRDNLADLTLSIAVIHHVSSVKRRLEAVWELIRCTRPKGKILIYVWSFEQDKNYIGYREFKSQDVLVPWNLQSVYTNTTPSTPGDSSTTGVGGNEFINTSMGVKDVKGVKGVESYGRYYHVFTREEVDYICDHFKDHVESTVGSDCNNWVIEMTKH
ncbi:tRNA (carboxymethyluridine(34)-5-O)-methyltransferase [Theileria orientalis]|uniref:tRNA (Carboxymethyluridine(34)-5-O)-methyltransferase n=1 Tax=Theileria orientalis TaxID=68886 RepID=A0A976M9K4_THEOR|nr:tRNA (carboxymethyluridine(34)-5-O)-methyltransferase [Theileria orientalis]